MARTLLERSKVTKPTATIIRVDIKKTFLNKSWALKWGASPHGYLALIPHVAVSTTIGKRHPSLKVRYAQD